MKPISRSSIPLEEEQCILISAKGTFVYRPRNLRSHNIGGFPIIITKHEIAFINAFIGIDLNIWITRENYFTEENGLYSI